MLHQIYDAVYNYDIYRHQYIFNIDLNIFEDKKQVKGIIKNQNNENII